MIKAILQHILDFFRKWFKENEEEIRKFLWELLISIVKKTRESQKGKQTENTQ